MTFAHDLSENRCTLFLIMSEQRKGGPRAAFSGIVPVSMI
jgi:hypothetical protein